MAANIYIHKKCQSVLSMINQIVGDQFADRKEEIMYLPVYADVMRGTIRIGTNIPVSLKYEHQLKNLQHIFYTPSSNQENKTLLPDTNYRDLSCSETLQPGHTKVQYSDDSSILNMLLELEPHKLVEFDRTESSSDEIIDITDEIPRKEETQYVVNQHCGEEPQNEIHAMNTSCLDEYDVVDLTSDIVNITVHPPKRKYNPRRINLSYKKNRNIYYKRYYLNRKLCAERFSRDLQELIKTNSKLKSDLLSLIDSVKRMKLFVLLTGKFKNSDADKIVNDAYSCHSVITVQSNEPQYNRRNRRLRGKISTEKTTIDTLEQVLEINKEIEINLSSLIVMVNEIKLMLLTSGVFKTQYLKQLQIHLRSCECMVNESCDSVEQKYNLEYLRKLNTTWKIVKPQSCSPRKKIKTTKLQSDEIEQTMGKLLKQCRKMNKDLWVIICSVLNILKDVK